MKKAFKVILLIIFSLHSYSEEPVYSGEIQGKVKVAASSKEWGTINWLIENGQLVKKGEVVAKLDSQKETERLEQHEEEMAKLQLDLENANKELAEVSKDQDVLIKQEILERDLKKVTYQIASQGVYGIDLARKLSNINNAKTELDKKVSIYEKKKSLYLDGLEQERVYLQSELDLKTAQASYEEQVNVLDQSKYQKEKDAKLAKIQLDIQEKSLEKAKQEKQNVLSKVRFKIQKIEETIINLTDSINHRKKEIVNHDILAPADGIAKHRTQHGSIIKVNDRVGRGFAVVDILYDELKRINIDIEEKYILECKLNQKAKIKILDTGEVVYGYVTKISNVPKDKNEKLDAVGRRNAGMSGITIFEAEITFEDPHKKYTVGLKAEVSLMKP